MDKHMLTTTDNPFNPFTHFTEWNAYDQAVGHHTLAYLARVVRTSDEISEADQDLAYERGIDEIIQHNLNGLYRKVSMHEVEVRQAS